ncbi:hypothetical protein PVAP13_5KG547707 [Panicum virgatum]|uniref:Uncharacterized protein n=1 Tax=Panicum virgatum TaxID=38727 RepID=A0A8T0SUA6_PANVG|nr:hypothetical protein PVAP13_5KG547707 [Panicum virgatum]
MDVGSGGVSPGTHTPCALSGHWHGLQREERLQGCGRGVVGVGGRGRGCGRGRGDARAHPLPSRAGDGVAGCDQLAVRLQEHARVLPRRRHRSLVQHGRRDGSAGDQRGGGGGARCGLGSGSARCSRARDPRTPGRGGGTSTPTASARRARSRSRGERTGGGTRSGSRERREGEGREGEERRRRRAGGRLWCANPQPGGVVHPPKPRG